MNTIHDVRVLMALLVLSVLALSACSSSTAPLDCVSIRAQVLELRTQATSMRSVARSVRDQAGGADASRALLSSAEANERMAETLAVPECAPYASAS